jgi:hypothetical protein
VGVSKRRRLGWAIAIATVSGTAAWAADPPAEEAPRRVLSSVYRLECPRLLADGRGAIRVKSPSLGEQLSMTGVPDLRLSSRWLVEARPNLGFDRLYSLEEQVAYRVAHAPSLEKVPAAPGRIELATLEVHLPF